MPLRSVSDDRPDGPAQWASDSDLVFRLISQQVKWLAEDILECRLARWSPPFRSAQCLCRHLPFCQATASSLMPVPVAGGANGCLISCPGPRACAGPGRNPQGSIAGNGGQQCGFIFQLGYPGHDRHEVGTGSAWNRQATYLTE